MVSQFSGSSVATQTSAPCILSDANQQWANRPADECFWTVDEMLAALKAKRNNSTPIRINPRSLKVVPTASNNLMLQGDDFKRRFSNFSFGQLCNLTRINADMLREQPAELAARNLNWALGARDTEDKATIALMDTKEMTIRGFNSDSYGRIWNADVVNRIAPMIHQGWRLPPARPSGNHNSALARKATAQDVLINKMPGLGIQEGDMIAPAGAYAGDRDMFLFLINEQNTIKAGNAELFRGFFIENAEVPYISFKITTFLLSTVCGNLICWDAQQVQRSRIVHRGDFADQRAWRSQQRELHEWANSSCFEMEERIRRAQGYEIGTTKEETVDVLFQKKFAAKRTLEAAYDRAVEHPEDGHSSPHSAWGMVQGFTRLSQESAFAGSRVDLDRQAAKILTLVN